MEGMICLDICVPFLYKFANNEAKLFLKSSVNVDDKLQVL